MHLVTIGLSVVANSVCGKEAPAATALCTPGVKPFCQGPSEAQACPILRMLRIGMPLSWMRLAHVHRFHLRLWIHSQFGHCSAEEALMLLAVRLFIELPGRDTAIGGSWASCDLAGTISMRAIPGWMTGSGWPQPILIRAKVTLSVLQSLAAFSTLRVTLRSGTTLQIRCQMLCRIWLLS